MASKRSPRNENEPQPPKGWITGFEPAIPRSNVSHIIGRLRVANEHAQKNSISIVGKDNRARRVIVPRGMMLDIVKDHWGDEVVATVHSSGKTFILDELESKSTETVDADAEH